MATSGISTSSLRFNRVHWIKTPACNHQTENATLGGAQKMPGVIFVGRIDLGQKAGLQGSYTFLLGRIKKYDKGQRHRVALRRV